MFETVTCPQCERHLQLPAEYLGKRVQCPSCQASFVAGAAKPKPKPKSPPEAIPVGPAPKPDLDDETAPVRRRRRLDVAKMTPPARKSPAKAIIILVVVGVFAVGGCCLVSQLGRVHVDDFQPVQKNPDFFERKVPDFGQLPPLIDAPGILNADEQRQHAQSFFDHFSAAMRNNNNVAESNSFDAAKLLGILFDEKLVPEAWRQNEDRLVDDVSRGVLQTSLYRGPYWTEFEIKTVKQTRPGELMVTTRHPNRGTQTYLRLRWWLVHRDRRWRIQEVEDPDFGVRLSLLVAAGLQPPNRGGPLVNPDLRAVRDAADAIVLRFDYDGAGRILGPVRAAGLPKAGAATYHILQALIQFNQKFNQNRFDEMLKSCDAAAQCQPDSSSSDYLRAVAYNSLNRSEAALKHIRLAREWLGDDPGVCYETGLAMQNLQRFAEAAALYRRTLDEQPDHHHAFLQLVRVVGPGVKNDDIGERFLKKKDPRKNFEEYAQDCWNARDASTVQQLAEAMCGVEPRYAEARYYLALAYADQQRAGPAVTEFRTALALQQGVFRRDQYFAEFARTNAFRDHPLEIYNQLPDRIRSFRALAEVLKNAGKSEDLRELVALHVKKHPKDEYVKLYQAELLLRDGKYALADAAFRQAFAAIKDFGVQERFRYSRLQARYHLGEVLAAYEEIEPRSATFRDLAEMCWLGKKAADLAKLVAAHTRNDPGDPQLAQFQWRVHVLTRRFDEAGKALKAVLGRNPGFDPDRQLVQSFLFDLIDAGEPLEAYRHAPDPSAALDLIAADLSGPYRSKELDAVVEEHRKRFPKDPILLMLAGQQAAAKKEWAKASQAYSEGWKQLPDAKRLRWTNGYLTARFKEGQAVKGYQETGKRPEHFRQLATMALREKDIDVFARLLEAHRPQRAADPDFAAYEARLKVLRGKSAEAAVLLADLVKNRPLQDQRSIGNSFMNDLAAFDLAAEAYRCVPDKLLAFANIAWKFRTVERAKEFERLIAEHAKHHPDDPTLAIERAELHMLRNEFAQAEQQFLLARGKGTPRFDPARFGLIKARVKLGRAVGAYHDLGANTLAFQDVANQCVALKDAAQLEAVLAAHRKAFPGLKRLTVWEVEIHWLKKDYEATVKAIESDRPGTLANPTYRWKCEGYLIRSLVRLKKPDDAVREAEVLTKRPGGPQILLALALASTGDVPRVLAFLESKKGDRLLIEDCYFAEDLGALLRGAAYHELHERFPPPPERKGPNVPFDDDWD